jgi:hypothetical protein
MTKEKQKLRETFCKLFALLGSPNEHEANAARQKINELAAKHKMTWNDVIELVGIGAGESDDNASTFDEFMEAMAKAGKKQSDLLIELAAAASLFRSPDGGTWADVLVKGHRETWLIRSAGFKGWLRYRFWQENNTSPSPEAIEVCLSHVEARALFEENIPIREVFLRVAGLDDKIYVDLCNDDWTSIEVDALGWRVVKEPPVRFSRNSGMKELPTPVSGGSLSDLHGLLSVDGDGLVIVVSWLLGALRGRSPYPVLCLAGPAGSSKSTAVCFLRDLIDPGKIEPGALPQEVRDLAIASAKRFVVGYDNLSGIPHPISDMLCRLATGGGFAVRQLYSDDGEVTFSHTRPIILAGIEDVVGRHDLTRRTLHITMGVIPAPTRKLLTTLKAEFRRSQPRILGRLLDITSVGLKNLPNTKMGKLPSLADFAQWMAACETAEWPAGTFARIHDENEQALAVASLEADVVAAHVIEFLETRGPAGWQGTAKALLAQIDARVDDVQKRGRGWPKTPHAMAGRVRRATEIFRTQGWRVEKGFSSGKDHARTISFVQIKRAAPTSETSERSDINDLGSDEGDNSIVRPSDPYRPTPPDQQPAEASSEASSDTSSDGNLLSGNGFGQSDVSDDVAPDLVGEPLCRRCGAPGNATLGQLMRGSHNGTSAHYHPRCWTEERAKGPYHKRAAGEGPTCVRCGVGANAWGELITCGPNGSAGFYHPRCWKEEERKPGRANND